MTPRVISQGQMPIHCTRRDFVRVVVGSAAALPFAARAQQPDRIRRIGVLSGAAEDDQDTKLSLAAFRQRLQQLG
jgi:putative ABC transport system substrate-binding protein